MNNRKRRMVFLLAVWIATLAGIPAYGAVKREKIGTLRLHVACEEKPEAGKEIGKVKVTTVNDKVEVSEEAYYYNPEDVVWIRGEVPVIRVEFSVKDSEKHYFTSSTKVSVSGFHSEVKSKKIVDKGAGIQVDIRLRKVGGKLEVPEELEWNEYRAEWSEVEGVVDYEVKLYRGNVSVVTKKVRRCEYDFYPYMNRAGDYTFRVRALGTMEDERGTWSDKSEEISIGEDNVYRGTPPSDSPAGSEAFGGSQSPLKVRGWIRDKTGWRYRQTNYQLAVNTWIFVDNNWFYLNEKGYMMTGWIFVDNNWFYLNPVSDGTRGAMKTGWQVVDGNTFYLNPVSDGTRGVMRTGWQTIEGQTYFFNPVSDGTRGAMKTGYQQVDGNWYYFDPGQGFLWKNQRVPNGRWADGNGILS